MKSDEMDNHHSNETGTVWRKLISQTLEDVSFMIAYVVYTCKELFSS